MFVVIIYGIAEDLTALFTSYSYYNIFFSCGLQFVRVQVFVGAVSLHPGCESGWPSFQVYLSEYCLSILQLCQYINWAKYTPVGVLPNSLSGSLIISNITALFLIGNPNVWHGVLKVLNVYKAYAKCTLHLFFFTVPPGQVQFFVVRFWTRSWDIELQIYNFLQTQRRITGTKYMIIKWISLCTFCNWLSGLKLHENNSICK